MQSRVKKLSGVALVVATLIGTGACSRPDENAPVRVTGDNRISNPVDDTVEEETTTTVAPTTTRFWGEDGPGPELLEEQKRQTNGTNSGNTNSGNNNSGNNNSGNSSGAAGNTTGNGTGNSGSGTVNGSTGIAGNTGNTGSGNASESANTTTTAG